MQSQQHACIPRGIASTGARQSMSCRDITEKLLSTTKVSSARCDLFVPSMPRVYMIRPRQMCCTDMSDETCTAHANGEALGIHTANPHMQRLLQVQ